MKFTILAGIVASVLLSPAALAQQPVQSPPAPDRIAAADALLSAMHFDRQTDRVIEAIITQMNSDIDQAAGSDLPADLRTKIKGIAATRLRTGFTEHRPEMRRGTALIYARHFTVPELQHLSQLQSDPLFVKMQDEMPQIMAETMKLTEDFARQESEKLEAEIKDTVSDYLAHKEIAPTS